MGTQEIGLSFQAGVIGKTITNTLFSVPGLPNKEMQVQRRSFRRVLPDSDTAKP